MSVKLNCKFAEGFVSSHEIEYMKPFAKVAHKMLASGEGQGNDLPVG